MPVHDWTRVDDGVFHQFHQSFVVRLTDRLNVGLLPDGVYAALERKLRVKGDRNPLNAAPDVLAVAGPGFGDDFAGGLSVVAAPPRVQFQTEAGDDYVTLADRVAVRTTDGDRLVAVFELVSPGNKSSEKRLGRFARKCGRLIERGVHLTLADLYPPTRRDPNGLHPVVWDQVQFGDYQAPPGKPFTLAAYSAGEPPAAYVQPVGLGDPLPDMPLFLTPERYIPLPLDAVYMDCWAAYPKRWTRVIEPPADA